MKTTFEFPEKEFEEFDEFINVIEQVLWEKISKLSDNQLLYIVEKLIEGKTSVMYTISHGKFFEAYELIRRIATSELVSRKLEFYRTLEACLKTDNRDVRIKIFMELYPFVKDKNTKTEPTSTSSKEDIAALTERISKEVARHAKQQRGKELLEELIEAGEKLQADEPPRPATQEDIDK